MTRHQIVARLVQVYEGLEKFYEEYEKIAEYRGIDSANSECGDVFEAFFEEEKLLLAQLATATVRVSC